ncbi:ROK family transcriptional regulator [Dehalococcoides mccartyi]|uniref:Glucokinase n=2 Tax=Dehalococcoides mccartyi TaxID=61435 RepID=A0A142V7W2_9CHLR|nr:ROK family protein [Dehalococcoides mccartyi]AGG07160.1 ROK family protein [Dehalococcoides mccartyi BTF08]AII60289.1 ROK family transcriptional regulator [Dehalococcoides mccartyi CG5]AMU85882.1 glucokinase [Dehalococcoides mccartyi]AOV98727.1 sugar kinase [Dehalococcoides mccartyi]KSV18143.1 ROK family transcriptional regulator [Dehalococcoides mccartyi]
MNRSNSEVMSKPCLCLDIGGSKIRSAVVTHDGRVVAWEQEPTCALNGVTGVFESICLVLDRLLERNNLNTSQFEALAAAVAGGIDMPNGLVTQSPHLPDWRDVPLRDMLTERYLKTFIINDASAAALGEHRLGVGLGVKNLVYLTVSTGIGGGIIINNELYLGQSGCAGEIGHMCLDINGKEDVCGNKGCLETLASGTAIVSRVQTELAGGEFSILVERFKADYSALTAEDIGRAASEGDRLCLGIIRQAGEYLGIGLVNIANIFNPELIILGGGVSKLGEIFIEPARQVLYKRAFRLAGDDVRLIVSVLGDNAGVIGAALYAYACLDSANNQPQ